MSTILVIEDDEGIRRNILDLLEAEDFTGLAADSGEVGVELAVKHLPDLIICDVAMPGIDGFEVFEILSAQPPTALIPFVFLSARAERGDVRRGMALGADDYLTKPFTRAELLDSIRIRLKRRRSIAGPTTTQPPDTVSSGSALGQLPDSPGREPAASVRMVALDPAMKAIVSQVDRIASSPISVLILGETGVGKEVIAEEIHRRSGRSGRFVALNCAALTESLLESELFGHEKGAFTGALQGKQGLFEAADGGTLFLDEVGELPQTTQVKLLRVLEDRKVMRVGGRSERSVDLRFVSATHRDVEAEAERGEFRRDLYFRLNGISLTIPALRERPLDLAALAERFIASSGGSIPRRKLPRLSPEALSILQRYDWPGNIRELRNALERAVLLCEGELLLPAHFPTKLVDSARTPNPTPDADPRTRLLGQIEQLERARVVEALARCGGNQTQAAELLGISRRTLVTRLASYDLPRPRKRATSDT